jgi:hypothetical protein
MLFFKKKKKLPEVENQTFTTTIHFKDGRQFEMDCSYPTVNDVAQRFSELIEYQEVIYGTLTSGEKFVFRTIDVKEIFINPEPKERE